MIARRVCGPLLAAVATVAGAVLPLVPAVPALAHGGDPTLVPVIGAITPALPPGVVIQARTGLSEQLLVGNPTAGVLTVLDPDGTPFLRVSKAGTFGNVTDPFFHRTLNPPDVPPRIPASARAGAAPRWVVLARTGEFGWFEPRLHPATPGTEAGTGVVATWQIGMRLGAEPVAVSGTLQRQAVTGTFLPSVDARRDGLQVTVAPGRVPALLLVAPSQRRIVVTGSDGEPFLRLGPEGVFANTASANFRDNLEFTDRAGERTGWIRVGEPGRVRWLDSRLQYSADRPPEVVERAGRPAQLGRWEVPLTVHGVSAPLTGSLSWLPADVPVGERGSGRSWLPALVVATVAVGTLTLAGVSRTTRKRRGMGKSGV